jgi:hypothetical protein
MDPYFLALPSHLGESVLSVGTPMGEGHCPQMTLITQMGTTLAVRSIDSCLAAFPDAGTQSVRPMDPLLLGHGLLI